MKNNLIKISAAIVALSIYQSVPVQAQSQTKEVTEVTRTHGDGSTTTTTTTKYKITDVEREKIRTYVKKTDKAKRAKGFTRSTSYTTEFPATWRERVVIGEPMPEVYYSQAYDLPSEIIELGQPDPATRLVALDGSVIRVETGTRRVLDVYQMELD
ncbi:MAG: hypothetical protein ACAI35_26915 [Candidatus Methylacidiphilales bacterium]|nr:hypothetical protein [Candidatus Methylacidiphilales bacterium]